MTAPRPDCPPWCTSDHARLTACSSPAAPIRLEAGSVNVYARRSPALGAHVTVAGSRFLHIANTEEARELAGLVGLLAGATPEQVRALAEHIRAAAGLIDPEGDA